MRFKLSFLFAFFALCSIVSCSDSSDDGPSSNNYGKIPTDNLRDVIKIEYKNGGAPVITNPNEDEVKVDLTGEHIVVTIDIDTTTHKEYNLEVSGATTNGSLKIYGEYKIGLYLNGVSITNPKGPAINIQNGKKISVHLGSENYLTDGVIYDDPVGEEQAKGTFFSEGQLVFSGESGYLEVRGKRGHAIVTDDYFKIESGTIKIPEAAKDGIHSNDTLFIEGGNLDIKSIGDGLQSERDAVAISGGNITINVSGNGSKGIKANTSVIIRKGTIGITTSGAKSTTAEDTSSVAGIKAKNNIEMHDGDLKVVSSGKGGKGISADEDINIRGGKVDITANDDAIKTNRNLTISGGDITVRSSQKKNPIDCDGKEDIKIKITSTGKP